MTGHAPPDDPFGELEAERTALPDGRYLIYYRWPSQEDAEEPSPQPARARDASTAGTEPSV